MHDLAGLLDRFNRLALLWPDRASHVLGSMDGDLLSHYLSQLSPTLYSSLCVHFVNFLLFHSTD